MTQEINELRRKLAQTAWTVPALLSITMPSHAQTSPAKPVEPTEPTEPVEPVEPTEPTEPVDPCVPPPTGIEEFTSPGTFTFTVPDCVEQVTITANGAGGGAGWASKNKDGSIDPDGGNAQNGEQIVQSLNVASGQTITIVVGEGGFSSANINATDLARGGAPDGQDATVMGFGGGGGGSSSVSGSGIDIVASGGNGGGLGRGLGGPSGGATNDLGASGATSVPLDGSSPADGGNGSVLFSW